MSSGRESLVKFICVDVKSGETQEKLKAKVLKAIHNSEKKTSPNSSITHPLQTWTEEAHSFPELRAGQVHQVVTNASHVTFLLKDGRACRIRVASWEESTSGSRTLSLDALRQQTSQQPRPSFQVLGDEEYALQLQAELNNRHVGWHRGDYRVPPTSVHFPRVSLPLHSAEVQSISVSNASPYCVVDYVTENTISSDWRNTVNSIGLDTQESAFMEDIANMTSRTSGRRGAVKSSETKKLAKVWPKMGSLEWLTVKQNPENPTDSSFVAMAAMHSEILLVSSEKRCLYSWACTNGHSPKPHPLHHELGLEGERIALLESSDIRTTLVTESGKVATFYDGLLRSTPDCVPSSLVQTLTHKAQLFPELEGDRITRLSVSSFLTCAVTAMGKVFWWGLCPPVKTSSPTASRHSSSSSSRGAVTDGSLVRLRNGPPCGPNALVFNETGHKPRVGKTMNIIEHSGLDPKTSILVKVYNDISNFPIVDARGSKSKLPKDMEGETYYSGLEVWSLSDVVFLDDSPAVLGRVVTVDQLQAIVDISCASSESGTMDSTSTAQSTLKVFKLNDIEPCMDKCQPVSVSQKGEGHVVSKATCDTSPSREERGVTVSHHIAGVVQRRPACLLTPSAPPHPSSAPASYTQPHPLRDQQDTPTNPPCTCIHGYWPLAVQFSDTGPIILAKRVSDGATFLVCSGHPGFPSFSSSSFVSLTSRDSKPGRSTIDQESVSAYDGGFDRPGPAGEAKAEEDTGLNLDGEAGRKGLISEEDTGLKSQVHPSFLKLHKSDAILLVDSNGLLCPLSEGLRLRPSPLPSQRGRRVGPMQPYKCIATRRHMAKKNSSSLLVVVVSQPQHLMPAVLSGDLTRVHSVISHLANNLSNQSRKSPQFHQSTKTATIGESSTSLETHQPLTESPDQGSKQPRPHEQPLAPPAKRSRISTETIVADSAVLASKPVYATLSSADMTSIDFDAELPVLSTEAVVRGVSKGWGLEVLNEKTDQNCTILHVCGRIDHTHSSKGKGSTSVLGSKSSSLGGGCGLAKDKSFEELRFEHMQENPNGCPLTLENAKSSCLPQQLLWILGRVLDCEPIRPTVVNLLCRCNREGHTPFLSAISDQNYAAALKILDFVEKVAPSHPTLFKEAILKPAPNSLSTLHLLLGSLSSTFDLRSMALYVHNLQLSTAKQLLRLFQVRYPSAFKAEIVNKNSPKEGSDGSSLSSEGSGSDRDETNAATSRNSFQPGRVRRSYRNIPRRRIARSQDNILSSLVKYGVVYFSNITELRAASQEMHGFRIVNSISRNTGFGATQTISYLSISREEPSDDGDDGETYSFMPDRTGLSSHLAPAPGSMYELMDGIISGSNNTRPPQKKKPTTHMLSSPDLARKLLHKLLSYQSLVTSLDSSGETALASLVHNPRCLEKVASLSISTPTCTLPSALGNTKLPGSGAGDCADSAVFIPTATEDPALQRLDQDLKALAKSLESSVSHSGSSFRQSVILPYVSLEESLDQQVANNMSQDPFVPQLATPLDLNSPASSDRQSHFPLLDPTSSQDMDCAPSPTQINDLPNLLPDTSVAMESVAGAMESVGVAMGSVTSKDSLPTIAQLEKLTYKGNKEVMDSQLLTQQSSGDSDSKLVAPSEKETWHFPSMKDQEGSVLLGKRSSSSLTYVSEEAPPTLKHLQEPLLFGKGSSVPLEHGHVASGVKDTPPGVNFNIIHTLFSNWHAIVTTILGFDPSSCDTAPSTSSSDLTPPTFSSVHLLDSFTTDLLLNCSDHVIDTFVNTIIERLNSAIELSGDHTLVSLLTQEIDYADADVVTRFLSCGDVGVVILVGRRFLSSAIRVLALEHSRVKNKFVEMQQQQARGDEQELNTANVPLGATPSRRGNSNASTSSQNSKKTSITSSITAILSRFSWLAVHALSQAAEACAYPVRLGISKPLGASSVIAEYQSNNRYNSSAAYNRLNNSSHQYRQSNALMRQLHVRAANMTSSAAARESSLPAEGLFLQPQLVDHETGLASSSRAAASTGLNMSIHNDSSEDEELAHPMEGVATSAGDGRPGSHSRVTTPTHPFPIDPTSPPYSTQIHNGVFLNLDSTSSSDEEGYHIHHPHDYLDWVDGGGVTGGVTNEDDNLDSVYMFAWALDGRRIGENGVGTGGRAESPNSITAPVMFNSTHEASVPLANIPSIRFGAGFLARTFARFVKDLVDISQQVTDTQPQSTLHLPPSVQHQLVSTTIQTLEQTWAWAVCVLDMAEGQLQQGQHFDVQRHVVSLRGGSGQNSSGEPRRASHVRASRSFIGSTPGEYVASLLRSRDHEGKDCLPVLDLYGYEHVVYVLDGLLYTLTHWPKHLMATQSDQPTRPHMTPPPSSQSTVNDEDQVSNKKRKIEPEDESHSSHGTGSRRFFERTESVLVSHEKDSTTQISNDRFFGVEGGASLALENPELVGPPNQWGKQVESFSRPLNEEYPLASRPYLLKPFARKEALFGGGGTPTHEEGGTGRTQEDSVHRKEGRKGRKRRHTLTNDGNGPVTMLWSIEHAQQRWHLAIGVFAHIFLAEGPGNERSNFLNAHAGFASRMARFRHQVSQLFDASQASRDWAGTVSSTLSIRVRRDRLMQDSLNTLQQLSQFHYSNVRVKFDGEDGSGPGVNRGFFASLSNDLKSNDVTRNPLNRLGLFFHEPGKQPEQSGLFAPHPFMPHTISSPSRASAVKAQRRDAFMAIGRFFGLCLWFRFTIPFMVCRHVAKMLLGRPLAWHDLAFYNADLYEGLRQMMLDAEQGKKDDNEFMETYCAYFEAPLPGKFLEPVLVELVPGGSKVPVSLSRVQEYVRLYSMFMMVGCVQEELNAMKQGLNDVIPNDLLSGLTAEDFQLLLSGGSADITITKLKSIIRFNHTHGSSRTICDRFEKMFWRIVSHMTNTQRQQLLYFATGSAALPASVDSSSRVASVSITLDVIGSRSTDSLPVASTCSQRMCIPLYPSYHILKKKLLQAIQCQAYGLG